MKSNLEQKREAGGFVRRRKRTGSKRNSNADKKRTTVDPSWRQEKKKRSKVVRCGELN
jgi:hypothetical protein